jgi:hypothetical protein
MFSSAATILLLSAWPAQPVVINEIHYDPPDKTVPEEFVELLNPAASPVDLSGWSLSGAVDYLFPAGTVLKTGEYLTVAQDPAVLAAGFPGARPVGPWSGHLRNEGETLLLRDAAGAVVDQVDYRRGFPWPTAGGAAGYSIELINPGLDNSLGGSWRLSSPPAGEEKILIPQGSVWRYRKGTQEASSPPSAWRALGFDDSGWLEGKASIGYGDPFVVTTLADMRGGYSSVFLRRRFNVPDPAAVRALILEVQVDDGINAWINGTHVARLNLPADEMAFDGLALSVPENQSFVALRLTDPGSYLVAGENVLAIQLHNVSLAGSSDAWIDARLTGAPSFAGPTPGARNSVYSEAAPPQLRNLERSPARPRSGEPVKISIKATDPQGVQRVALQYQTVDPGGYLRLGDPAYQTRWTEVEMRDDGLPPDAQAGDSVFTVLLPGSLQLHRRLVRFRITASDLEGQTVEAPYGDDPQPNFAYFVYDGVPAWRGASHPGFTPVHQFDAAVMGSLPVYHLLAVESDVISSQYDGAYESVHFPGALVYDGEVYDHIEFENRGEFSTYVSGKNKWRFHFNRGHELQPRDDYGRLRLSRARTLEFSACATPWVPPNRGMAGLDESLAFRLYELAGVLSPRTAFIQFRVIDQALEASPTDQYRGDLWGLYLTLEHTDGAFLDERGLPDGNTYKIEGGNGDQRNQGPTQPKGSADYDAFRNGFNSSQPIGWWRANVDLPGYYGFRAVDRAVNDMDLRDGWNHCQYHNPETGRWTAMPWDLDMLYMPVTHWSGVINIQNAILQHPALWIEYQNRAREIQDLLFTEDQLGGLVDELSAFVSPPGAALTFAQVDEAMWNYNPRTTDSHRGAFYRNPASQSFIGGTVTRTLVSADHAGMEQWIKDFILTGYGAARLEAEAADPAIPDRPEILSAGSAGFPIDDLVFRSSPFSDPQGASTFGAMMWRVAEITPPGSPRDPHRPNRYEVEPGWESPVLTRFEDTFRVPAYSLRVGGFHRARVRMMDQSGRWSHWSEPLEFTAAPPLSPLPEERYLRITEILYHSDSPDLEFLEVKNIGSEPLDLRNVSIQEGVQFFFAGSGVEELAPGALAVVVKDRKVFEGRYGTAGIAVAGEYQGSLSNGGERLSLIYGQNTVILDFTYLDSWWPRTDGGGRSLVFRDPSLPPEAWGDGASWGESADPGGSPGRDEPAAPGPRRLPGDLNVDGSLDLSDAVRLLLHLFSGGLPLPCGGTAVNAGGNLALADFDGDGALRLTDAVALLEHLFRSGPPHVLGTFCRPIDGCDEGCGG